MSTCFATDESTDGDRSRVIGLVWQGSTAVDDAIAKGLKKHFKSVDVVTLFSKLGYDINAHTGMQCAKKSTTIVQAIKQIAAEEQAVAEQEESEEDEDEDEDEDEEADEQE